MGIMSPFSFWEAVVCASTSAKWMPAVGLHAGVPQGYMALQLAHIASKFYLKGVEGIDVNWL